MTATATGRGTADQVSAAVMGADWVEGPLKGNHHQTFAVRVDRASVLAGQFPWLKLREPRDGVFWYDMRWFPSEEYVLRLLRDGFGDTFRHVPRVCEQRVQDEASPVRRIGLIQFIEGVTLDKVRSHRPGRIADRYVRQIEELFGTLASVDAGSLVGHGSPAVEGCAGCDLASWPEQGGSTQFLGRLKHFTFDHAYEQRRRDMDDLLADLGVPSDKLAAFAERRPELTDRPRKLLHGDLHKKNFVVDRAGVLWTIDWELALVGDPLYDLATHLHLMAYPSDQEADVISRWERAVGAEAAAGAREDLPHYRAFKRVQSLCTDVLRTVARLSTAAREDGEGMADGAPAGHRSGDRPAGPVARLRGAAAVVRRALEAAQPHLEVDKTQPPAAVEMALQAFLQRTEDV